MSHDQDKAKHSTRLAKAKNIIKKQLAIAKQHRVADYTTRVEQEPHRLVKHHAMDCGNPACYVCGNPRKTHKDKLTAQEKRLYQDIDRPHHGLVDE